MNRVTTPRPTVVELRVFRTAELPGSPQLLHILPSLAAMQDAAEQTPVTDDCDHSFVFLDSPRSAVVRWKNCAGAVRFCGSAAYGLAWLAYRHFGAETLQITAPHVQLHARSDPHGVVLTMPAATVSQQSADAEGALYTSSENGIFLLHAQRPIGSIDLPWVMRYVKQHALADIHGFCAFAWDATQARGTLRYFVPWHGRNEDHVTGSIQQYLTPLIHNLFGSGVQTWTQMSAQGGQLRTQAWGNAVQLSGDVAIA